MNDTDLMRVLQKAVTHTVPLPKAHPDRKSQCPTIARIWKVAADGKWQDSDHSSHCGYCQKSLAGAWKEEPPSLITLLRYVASPETFENRRAMEIYVNHTGDARAKLAARLVATRHQGTALEEWLAAIVGFFV